MDILQLDKYLKSQKESILSEIKVILSRIDNKENCLESLSKIKEVIDNVWSNVKKIEVLDISMAVTIVEDAILNIIDEIDEISEEKILAFQKAVEILIKSDVSEDEMQEIDNMLLDVGIDTVRGEMLDLIRPFIFDEDGNLLEEPLLLDEDDD